MTVHPRFFDEKLKRPARHQLFAWIAGLTRLPVIANGDILGPQTLDANPQPFAPVAALMVGRMAVARPWLFARWNHPGPTPDYGDAWFRLFEYVREDFPDEKALRRVRTFTAYYARNFAFGHRLASAVRSAPDLDSQRERAARFFEADPPLVSAPDFSGVQ